MILGTVELTSEGSRSRCFATTSTFCLPDILLPVVIYLLVYDIDDSISPDPVASICVIDLQICFGIKISRREFYPSLHM